MASLNDWTEDQASRHYHDCVTTFRRRSEVPWMLDVCSIVKDVTVRSGWQLHEDLWLSTAGRAGVAKTKLLGSDWHLAGEHPVYVTTVNIELLRNIPQG